MTSPDGAGEKKSTRASQVALRHLRKGVLSPGREGGGSTGPRVSSTTQAVAMETLLAAASA